MCGSARGGEGRAEPAAQRGSPRGKLRGGSLRRGGLRSRGTPCLRVRLWRGAPGTATGLPPSPRSSEERPLPGAVRPLKSEARCRPPHRERPWARLSGGADGIGDGGRTARSSRPAVPFFRGSQREPRARFDVPLATGLVLLGQRGSAQRCAASPAGRCLCSVPAHCARCLLLSGSMRFLGAIRSAGCRAVWEGISGQGVCCQRTHRGG